ncbi:hypothetical protein [Adhaeribacter radiodurans]|nr:hypothetical protein [Adhaeribacter radiodurans]
MKEWQWTVALIGLSWVVGLGIQWLREYRPLKPNKRRKYKNLS